VPAFEADYRFILDASRQANPGLRLVLLDPFVLRCGELKEEPAWTSRRAATDGLRAVVGRLARDYGAVHVRTQDAFDAAAAAVSPGHWSLLQNSRGRHGGRPSTGQFRPFLGGSGSVPTVPPGVLQETHWIWDGVHPLPQGHELVARLWLRAVGGRWGRRARRCASGGSITG
jgi:lysophospholipase L1-like esterase